MIAVKSKEDVKKEKKMWGGKECQLIAVRSVCLALETHFLGRGEKTALLTSEVYSGQHEGQQRERSQVHAPSSNAFA